MIFTNIETVNFYGDLIEVAVNEENEMYVAIAQITGYLGMDHEAVVAQFENDPRVDLGFINDQAIVELRKLNGFLMLLKYSDVQKDLREDLLKYQTECFEVLHDYWIHGVALNRRETPYDIRSNFKDERSVSRPALIKAVDDYYREDEEAKELGKKQDLFDKVLADCYAVIGLEPLHEFEKLTGTEARYLAWVESTYSAVIGKFAKFGQTFDDVFEEASKHVKEHLDGVGRTWLVMADNMPGSVYHD